MFKRRVAILGAVGVLVLTGLAGSAMAADQVSPTAGHKVTCTTSDGKTVEFTAVPAADGGSAVVGLQAEGDEAVKTDRLEADTEGVQSLGVVPATKTVPATKAGGENAPELTEPPAGAETIRCEVVK
ncbi:hypothetical protein [Streptosporangium roseum]|uniref:hypothetical protein n=1 Tax=Streptosporangium roseum TaxID=2001 RepID=UPI003330F241